MIDFHNHILPGIDDGAKTMDDTIALLKEAKLAGFNKIIFTPHYKENFYEAEVPQRMDLFEEVKSKISENELDIEVYLGNEIYMDGNNITEYINDLRASTLNDTKYVLFEIPMHTKPFDLYDLVYEIKKEKLVPVLAHPERYSYIQNHPGMVYELIEKGVLMQQNYGSIVGQYGKKAQIIAEKMLKANAVHFLGSDVHRTETIYKIIPKSIRKIRKIVGDEQFKEISEINPSKVLENERIDIFMPEKINLNFIEKMKIKSK